MNKSDYDNIIIPDIPFPETEGIVWVSDFTYIPFHGRFVYLAKVNKKRIRRVMKLFGIKPYRRHGRKLRKARDLGQIAAPYQNWLLVNEGNAIYAIMDKFSKDPAHDAPLILEIIEIVKGTNIPESGKKEMLNFFQGTYFELLGRAEARPFKKIQQFKKSLKYFTADKEIKRVKSEMIQAEISLMHENRIIVL